MEKLREIEVEIGGVPTTLLVNEEDARRYGKGKPEVENAAAPPEGETAAVSNKPKKG